MTGIYKIQNKITNKIYIGQSVSIKDRWRNHLYFAYWNDEKNHSYNYPLYRDIRELGKENFSFSLIEECDSSLLNEREIYWISFYDSYNNGYNQTSGGDSHRGDSHPRASFTNEEIYEIRELYASKAIKSTDAYQKFYSHRIGPSGFKKIWNGETWKDIHMDVYTEENKAYHKFLRNSNSENNSHAKLTENDVRTIRIRKKNGETLQEVYKDYQILTYGSFKCVWYNKNWKHIIV